MVGVIDVGELVENNVIAERLRDVHQADIERDDDRAVGMMSAGAPAGIGVGETDFIVMIAVELSKIIKAIGEVFLGFFHEDFLFSISRSLRRGVFDGQFFADGFATLIQKAFGKKSSSVGRH